MNALLAYASGSSASSDEERGGPVGAKRAASGERKGDSGHGLGAEDMGLSSKEGGQMGKPEGKKTADWVAVLLALAAPTRGMGGTSDGVTESDVARIAAAVVATAVGDMKTTLLGQIQAMMGGAGGGGIKAGAEWGATENIGAGFKTVNKETLAKAPRMELAEEDIAKPPGEGPRPAGVVGSSMVPGPKMAELAAGELLEGPVGELPSSRLEAMEDDAVAGVPHAFGAVESAPDMNMGQGLGGATRRSSSEWWRGAPPYRKGTPDHGSISRVKRRGLPHAERGIRDGWSEEIEPEELYRVPNYMVPDRMDVIRSEIEKKHTAKHIFLVPCVGYLDDFFMAAPTRAEAEEFVMHLVDFVSFLKFTVNNSKYEGGLQRQEFLAVRLSTEEDLCTATGDKDYNLPEIWQQ
ncbi:hypothetical protein CYMTET_23408 [Cymbomonas tetramitiformis]|uniref:Reverse transcriptase domain-containing protein n=1 Tax=Cymbomonas tetramitiformis TaxID=36881 RepID=A0AAE0L0Y5_9CHLO|nr:hypothetical protein CYMTET_23408 [Cymbomonas tetramitiformis]